VPLDFEATARASRARGKGAQSPQSTQRSRSKPKPRPIDGWPVGGAGFLGPLSWPSFAMAALDINFGRTQMMQRELASQQDFTVGEIFGARAASARASRGGLLSFARW
jgi:hypothetical protein